VNVVASRRTNSGPSAELPAEGTTATTNTALPDTVGSLGSSLPNALFSAVILPSTRAPTKHDSAASVSLGSAGMAERNTSPGEDTTDSSTEGIEQGSSEAPRAIAGRASRADRGARSAAAAEAARPDFWGRVVDLQRTLELHPLCPKGEALALALGWVVASATLPRAPGERARDNGTPTSRAGNVASSGRASAASAPTKDLGHWVQAFHDDLSARATRALVSLWQQRDSALRAATGRRL
jgi:hypothetical protein